MVADINALPSSSELTLDPYVLQLLDRVQAEYNALTDAQKLWLRITVRYSI